MLNKTRIDSEWDRSPNDPPHTSSLLRLLSHRIIRFGSRGDNGFGSAWPILRVAILRLKATWITSMGHRNGDGDCCGINISLAWNLDHLIMARRASLGEKFSIRTFQIKLFTNKCTNRQWTLREVGVFSIRSNKLSTILCYDANQYLWLSKQTSFYLSDSHVLQTRPSRPLNEHTTHHSGTLDIIELIASPLNLPHL
jgi:hypothetical protein